MVNWKQVLQNLVFYQQTLKPIKLSENWKNCNHFFKKECIDVSEDNLIIKIKKTIGAFENYQIINTKTIT